MNILNAININIPKPCDKGTFACIAQDYTDLGNIFSYIVYNKETNYVIQFNISETEKYNTISAYNALIECFEIIANNKSDKNVIGYKQPDINILVEIYKPLIDTLVNEQLSHWNNFDYKDLKQMCYLVMVILYRKQYYINKAVLRKSFCNYVLMELRKQRNAPEIISMNDLIVDKSDDKTLTIEDIILDTNYDNNLERSQELEFNHQVFIKIKDIAIKLIGERSFEQLYREYTTGNTTNVGRKNMQRIKQYLTKLNISRSNIEKIL